MALFDATGFLVEEIGGVFGNLVIWAVANGVKRHRLPTSGYGQDQFDIAQITKGRERTRKTIRTIKVGQGIQLSDDIVYR